MKFARCGYGSDGRGTGKTKDGYLYVVSDNVRTGQTLQVVATQYKSRKKFATTAVTKSVVKQTSAKGVEYAQDAHENGADNYTRAYTGKELGAQGSKTKKTALDSDHKKISQYNLSTRAKALEPYVEQGAELSKYAQETFDEYSKKYM